MERNSLLSSSLRDYNNVRDRAATAKNTTTKMMSQSYVGGEDYSSIAGFSWPPRCYTCSFCKREFRSAQALGGHMNVHRRDRARLRQSPPPPPPPNARYNHHHHLHHHHHPILNLNLNPNPNPNFSTSLSPSLPSLVSPPISALSSPSPASPGELKKWVLDTLDPAPAHGKVSVRLNLEIGQVSDSKEDLDLELRLGYYY